MGGCTASPRPQARPGVQEAKLQLGWVRSKHPPARRGVGRGEDVPGSRDANGGRGVCTTGGSGTEAQARSGRRHHQAAGRGGGACRAPPRAGPLCARSPPPPRPRPQLPPDTHALSTSSRTFHMFSIAPRAARPAAACRRTPRTPGRLRAGAGPGPGRCRHPPPRTLPRWSSFSRPQPRRLR